MNNLMKQAYLVIGLALIGIGFWLHSVTVKPKIVIETRVKNLTSTERDSIEKAITAKFTIVKKGYELQIRKLKDAPPETTYRWTQDTVEMQGLVAIVEEQERKITQLSIERDSLARNKPQEGAFPCGKRAYLRLGIDLQGTIEKRPDIAPGANFFILDHAVLGYSYNINEKKHLIRGGWTF